jgi:hypothetical protein
MGLAARRRRPPDPAAGNHTADRPHHEEHPHRSPVTSAAGRRAPAARPPSWEASTPAAEPPCGEPHRRLKASDRPTLLPHHPELPSPPPRSSLHPSTKRSALSLDPIFSHGTAGSGGCTTRCHGGRPMPASSVVEPRIAAPTPVHRREEERGHAATFLVAARDPGSPLGAVARRESVRGGTPPFT